MAVTIEGVCLVVVMLLILSGKVHKQLACSKLFNNKAVIGIFYKKYSVRFDSGFSKLFEIYLNNFNHKKRDL